ncbi:hypothetical protein OPT61_g8549 [Boeremia exigua]|uniref:Uncharacterized protein n=1 Tax=Boeremia exigua TaxID=749465 RepID=A0ACC2HXT4_9PLEO|nr:hypothetical protein OPT61_g8549 [Boeremia exigua]
MPHQATLPKRWTIVFASSKAAVQGGGMVRAAKGSAHGGGKLRSAGMVVGEAEIDRAAAGTRAKTLENGLVTVSVFGLRYLGTGARGTTVGLTCCKVGQPPQAIARCQTCAGCWAVHALLSIHSAVSARRQLSQQTSSLTKLHRKMYFLGERSMDESNAIPSRKACSYMQVLGRAGQTSAQVYFVYDIARAPSRKTSLAAQCDETNKFRCSPTKWLIALDTDMRLCLLPRLYSYFWQGRSSFQHGIESNPPAVILQAT